MFIGILQVSFEIPDSFSIKHKRSVVSSLKQRLRNTFNVSVAETTNLNNINTGGLSVVFVSSDKQYAHKVMSKIISFFERDKRIVMVDISTEVMP